MIDRLRATWGLTHGPTCAALVVGFVVGVVLVGGSSFGAWQVAFGVFVTGDWRAGVFGVALALACGVLRAIDGVVLRAVLGGSGRARITAS